MPAPSSSFTKVWHSDTYPAINPTKPELSVAGKSVVITGGGAGIGGGSKCLKCFISNNESRRMPP